MTSPNDFDRRIGAWLETGPSRAPERTLEAALTHARSHPRRRDPLAVLRRDPMGAGRSGGALRPLVLVAALGLVVVAAFGVATVGGVFDRGPSVVPPTAPAPTGTAAPTGTPAPSATPTGPAIPATTRVALIDDINGNAFVEITDQSGRLVSARSGQQSEAGEIAGDIGVTNLPGDPAAIVLTWVGMPCDTRHDLTIAPDGRTLTVSRAACSGDTLGVGRVLILTFDGPVPASEVHATLQTTGG